MKVIYTENEMGLWKCVLYETKARPKILRYIKSGKINITIQVYSHYRSMPTWLKGKTYENKRI